MNTQDWNQGTLLQVSGQYWQTCTLHTGVKLEIFTKIGSHRPRGDEIADQLNMDARGVIVLLDALTAMGLLTKSNEAYANTETASQYLAKTSAGYIGQMILHHHHLAESRVKGLFHPRRLHLRPICPGPII